MKIIFFASLLLLSSMSWAGNAQDKQAIQLSVAAGNISQQRHDIQQKLTQSEYSELTQSDRVVVNHELELLVSNSLAGNDAIVAQDKVNGILKQAFADSKLICTYEQSLGSNMKKRQCTTVAAKKRSYEKTQQTLEMQ